MLKETNLKEVKDVALSMLYLDIVQNEKFPFLIQHPFFNTQVAQIKTQNGFELVDITVDDNLDKARDHIKDSLNGITDYMTYLVLIHKPYLPVFFKYTCDYLSEKDYSEFLSEMWTLVEFTNTDSEIPPKEFIKYFKRANLEYLMDEDELEKFHNLPDTLTVYRGVGIKSTVKGLSWTTNQETAEWFATRFTETGGKVYEATIQKKDVLACFDGRDEDEILLDYTKLQNVKEI